jgi:FkbM family methyltransferase
MQSAWNQLARAVKETLKQRFPSLWLHWHLARCAVEPELALLKHIVPRDGVAVDIGANFGLYTRELARITDVVHAFEPSKPMAGILRRTSAANVIIHEVALSDRDGEACLRIPKGADGLVHSLASIEQNAAHIKEPCVSIDVPLTRLDSVVRDNVKFVKIDVEGHELKVLEGAIAVLEQSHPIFLVEAEERHRAGAVTSIFRFFREHGYQGLFLKGDSVLGAEAFDAALLQSKDSLRADGSRTPGRHYVNNFFFFPPPFDGRPLLLAGLQSLRSSRAAVH